MVIFKIYYRFIGSRNLYLYIFFEINIFIVVGKIYVLISFVEFDELYIEIIYVYFILSYLKKLMYL